MFCFSLQGKLLAQGPPFYHALSCAIIGPLRVWGHCKGHNVCERLFIIADFGFNAVYLVDSQKSYTLSSLFLLRLAWSLVLLIIAYAFLRFLPIGVYDGYTTAVRLGIFCMRHLLYFNQL